MRWQFSLCVSIVCLCFIRAKSIPGSPEDLWSHFKLDFHKIYRSEDEAKYRKEIFTHNVQRINQHNEQFVKGEVSFRKEIDQYTDMGDNEVPNSLYNMLTNDEPMYTKIPKQWDLRDHKMVTKVKDQGDCENGDWAFATVGALEGLLSKKDEQCSPELSAQELIDCSETSGNFGCEHGTVKQALNYIQKYGISTETSYPFNGKQATACSNKQLDKIAKDLDINFDIIPRKDEVQMRRNLYLHGPIVAIIDASLHSFINYTRGVYKDEKCADSTGKHNVLIVGYGENEPEGKYWIVKNSWGEEWGEKGYIKIRRDENMCGIANDAHYLSVDKSNKTIDDYVINKNVKFFSKTILN